MKIYIYLIIVLLFIGCNNNIQENYICIDSLNYEVIVFNSYYNNSAVNKTYNNIEDSARKLIENSLNSDKNSSNYHLYKLQFNENVDFDTSKFTFKKVINNYMPVFYTFNNNEIISIDSKWINCENQEITKNNIEVKEIIYDFSFKKIPSKLYNNDTLISPEASFSSFGHYKRIELLTHLYNIIFNEKKNLYWDKNLKNCIPLEDLVKKTAMIKETETTEKIVFDTIPFTNFSLIKNMKFKEKWTFDKSSLNLNKEILAYCVKIPCLDNKGEIIKEIEVWIENN